MSRFWSKKVHELTPYTPGEQPKVDALLKLNTNENPYGPSPRVHEAIAKANSEQLRKYPDPQSNTLKNTLAQHFALKSDQIFVGNSSDEVLAHAFQALLKQHEPLLFPDITYSFYPVYCKLFGIHYRTIPVRQDYEISLSDYSSDNGGIIFANPNAPTGLIVRSKEIEALLQSNQHSVVVVDEAYADFGDQSAVGLVDQYPNLLVIQTLSKSRSLAGLRVGWACGNADLIAGMERVKNSFHPYALNSLAQAGAQAAIEDVSYFKSCCRKIIATRNSSTAALRELGFDVLPSSANFLMVKHSKMPAKSIFQQLRAQKIIVRYFDLPRLEDHLRISIGTDEQMNRLHEVLREILSADS